MDEIDKLFDERDEGARSPPLPSLSDPRVIEAIANMVTGPRPPTPKLPTEQQQQADPALADTAAAAGSSGGPGVGGARVAGSAAPEIVRLGDSSSDGSESGESSEGSESSSEGGESGEDGDGSKSGAEDPDDEDYDGPPPIPTDSEGGEWVLDDSCTSSPDGTASSSSSDGEGEGGSGSGGGGERGDARPPGPTGEGTRLVVSRLPPQADEAEVRAVFRPYGRLLEVLRTEDHFVEDGDVDDDTATVTFADAAAAAAAQRGVDNRLINGTRWRVVVAGAAPAPGAGAGAGAAAGRGAGRGEGEGHPTALVRGHDPDMTGGDAALIHGLKEAFGGADKVLHVELLNSEDYPFLPSGDAILTFLDEAAKRAAIAMGILDRVCGGFPRVKEGR